MTALTSQAIQSAQNLRDTASSSGPNERTGPARGIVLAVALGLAAWSPLVAAGIAAFR
ncbi:hypothetical protein [Acetobacter fallax]|uniref:Uncharacterized protein n=1 Tax=Acetobacter fallax TaxID=1737473 RepID=A0ABX0K9F6_9PROT|nr:hypothetical protein [Acetobacter fallax]NHO33039.1 hypothetical protein [Acetobacter fallax]NHO36593.1 hypothetical protein [Acetobacter fallax]